MSKNYPYRKNGIGIILAISIIGLMLAIRSYNANQVLQALLYFFCAAMLIKQSFTCFFLEAHIDNNSIALKTRQILLKELEWINIDRIIDDSPFPWWKSARIYHLMPKWNPYGPPKKRLTLTASFKNFPELVTEIIVRVPPGTQVDPSILYTAPL